MNSNRSTIISKLDSGTRERLFEYLLRLADDQLVLSHRLCEWCGHAPILEEDIAISNLALDGIGAAEALYQLAAEVEGQGNDENRLAYFRDATDFKNCYLVELPKGDFAVTMLRQFLFDSFALLQFEGLQKCSFEPLSELSAKFVKELRYHIRHSSSWLIRLGNGTQESLRRLQAALDQLWRYTGELFERDQLQQDLQTAGIAPEMSSIQAEWLKRVRGVLSESQLIIPENTVMCSGARAGLHSEHLGHLLNQMQILPRSYPDASWS